MAEKTKTYATTKSAKKRLAEGDFKRRCGKKGCACGSTANAPAKESANGKSEEVK
jgi:hypothetical protein